MGQPRKKQDLQDICQCLADALGNELVDAGIEKESSGRYLRIYIDKPGGVSLNDCEAYHRAVQPKVEHIDYDFLEVSSPGIDRPIKTPRDFEKHAGQPVIVKLFQAIEKRKAFEGILVGLEDGEVVLTDDAGQTWRFEQRRVALVRPQVSVEGIDDVVFEDVPLPGEGGGRVQ